MRSQAKRTFWSRRGVLLWSVLSFACLMAQAEEEVIDDTPPDPPVHTSHPAVGEVVVDPYRSIEALVAENSSALKEWKSVERSLAAEQYELVGRHAEVAANLRGGVVELGKSGLSALTPQEGSVAWGVEQWVRYQISKLPAPGLEAYRKRVDNRAQVLFAERKGERDEVRAGRLRELLQKYYNSSFGDEALEWLGDLAFRDGEMDVAENYYRQLLTEVGEGPLTLRYPDPPPERAPQTYAKYLLTRLALGETSLRENGAQRFRERFPDVDHPSGFLARTGVDEKRKPLKMADVVSQALRQDGFETFFQRTAEWNTLGGAIRGQSIVFPEPGSFEAHTLKIPDAMRWGANGDDGLGEYYPQRSGSALWIADDAKIAKIALRRERDKVEVDGKVWFHDPKIEAASEAVPLCLQNQYVYARTGSDRIVALSEGREGAQWEVTTERLLPVLGEKRSELTLSFEGTPVADRERVYVSVLVRHRAETPKDAVNFPLADREFSRFHYLFALDAFTGKVVWHTMVGHFKWLESGVAQALAPPRKIRGPEPFDYHYGRQLVSVSGGRVVVLTNDGMIASIAASSGELVWLTKYPTRQMREPRRRQEFSAPVIGEGHVAVIPNDTNRLYFLDERTGTLRGETKVVPAMKRASATLPQVLAIHRGQVVVQGDDLWVYDLSTAKLHWSFSSAREGFVGYRGMVTDRHVVWPTNEGFLSFSLQSGEAQQNPSFQAAGSEGRLAATLGEWISVTPNELVIFSPRK